MRVLCGCLMLVLFYGSLYGWFSVWLVVGYLSESSV